MKKLIAGVGIAMFALGTVTPVGAAPPDPGTVTHACGGSVTFGGAPTELDYLLVFTAADPNTNVLGNRAWPGQTWPLAPGDYRWVIDGFPPSGALLASGSFTIVACPTPPVITTKCGGSVTATGVPYANANGGWYLMVEPGATRHTFGGATSGTFHLAPGSYTYEFTYEGDPFTQNGFDGKFTIAACPTPTPTPTPTTTCQQTGNQLVQNVTFTTSEGTFPTLAGHVAPGDHVVANFTVPANCSVVLSFVSYQAPGPTFDANTASQQTVFDSQDGVTFAAGDHSMAVTVPPCYFQVEFVRGTVIQHLGPAGSTNFYGAQGRLISEDTGGTTACGGGGGTQGLTTPTTPTTPPQTGVLGITTPGTGVTLAIGASAALVSVGLLLVLAAARVRRKAL
jgi:hypothetical protein